MKKVEVNDFVENEDGSATITVSLDYDTLLMFARKGILATLIEAANKVIENESQDQ
jgi:hypothetical protein